MHKLQLKIGAPVICIRNLCRKTGLMNGTRGIVTGLYNHSVQIKVSTGPMTGTNVFIPRINLESSNTNYNLAIRFTRRQYPLKLAWVMTINKSQGQTLKRVGLMLPDPVFAHGQLYVGLSRVTSQNGLRIAAGSNINEDPEVVGIDNIVWPEVFL